MKILMYFIFLFNLILGYIINLETLIIYISLIELQKSISKDKTHFLRVLLQFNEF